MKIFLTGILWYILEYLRVQFHSVGLIHHSVKVYRQTDKLFVFLIWNKLLLSIRNIFIFCSSPFCSLKVSYVLIALPLHAMTVIYRAGYWLMYALYVKNPYSFTNILFDLLSLFANLCLTPIFVAVLNCHEAINLYLISDFTHQTAVRSFNCS